MADSRFNFKELIEELNSTEELDVVSRSETVEGINRFYEDAEEKYRKVKNDVISSQAERDAAKANLDAAKADKEYGILRDIEIDKIDAFPGHPFKIIKGDGEIDDDMAKLMSSIEEVGLLEPIVVRRKDSGRYELISGHRRKRACELLGLKTMLSHIVDIDEDAAVIQMVDSNLKRDKILPSEKAFAYKMRLDAKKRQGNRSDLTFSPGGKKLNSNEELAKLVGESKSQIQRYIRLTELIPSLLECVDEGRIKLKPADQLSHISENGQNLIASYLMGSAKSTKRISEEEAKELRKTEKEKGKLTPEDIKDVLEEFGGKVIYAEPYYILNTDKLRKALPQTPMFDLEPQNEGFLQDYILEAITEYTKNGGEKKFFSIPIQYR